VFETRPAGVTSTGRRLLILREISVMQDDDGSYYDITGFVYIGGRAFTLDEIWGGVDAAERAGVSLGEIGRALTHNWPAAVTALALGNIGVLRALVDEASP
jgi:hypothetical protein